MIKHIPLMKSDDSNFLVSWRKICLESQTRHDEWIIDLRAQGVKAAHPNDGWVDRKNRVINFAYPQFFDHPKVGDYVVLGWPPHSDTESKNILVRITTIMEPLYCYEIVETLSPEQKVAKHGKKK